MGCCFGSDKYKPGTRLSEIQATIRPFDIFVFGEKSNNDEKAIVNNYMTIVINYDIFPFLIKSNEQKSIPFIWESRKRANSENIETKCLKLPELVDIYDKQQKNIVQYIKLKNNPLDRKDGEGEADWVVRLQTIRTNMLELYRQTQKEDCGCCCSKEGNLCSDIIVQVYKFLSLLSDDAQINADNILTEFQQLFENPIIITREWPRLGGQI